MNHMFMKNISVKKCLRACLFTVPICFTASVFADDAGLLKAHLTGIESLHSEFSQKVTDVNNKNIQNGTGVFALAYPNQFYWHLTSPDESLIVADGKDVWIYNPFAEEVSVLDMAKAIEASPMALLVHRDDATWSQYNVTKSADCYNITPKAIDSGVSQVKVCFNGSTLSDFILEDEQGNVSQFTLSKQRILTSTESTLFQFAVPDGVDVDDQRQRAAK